MVANTMQSVVMLGVAMLSVVAPRWELGTANPSPSTKTSGCNIPKLKNGPNNLECLPLASLPGLPYCNSLAYWAHS